MRKNFLIIFYIIFTFASLDVLAQENVQECYSLSDEKEPQEQEEIYLFQNYDDNDQNPYSTYDGTRTSAKTMLKGSIHLKDMKESNTKRRKDGQMVTYQTKKPKLGELILEGDIYGISTIGGNSLFQKDRFGIKTDYQRQYFREELARNAVTIQPELYLSKSLKLKTSTRQVMEQAGSINTLGIEYRFNDAKLKNITNLRFELNATSIIDRNNQRTNRFGWTTSYDF